MRGSFTAFRMTTQKKQKPERKTSKPLGLAGEDEGDVVGLLFGADPCVEGEHYLGGDHMEGLVAVAADDLHQALLAELTEVVLGLGDAVGVGDEDVSGLHGEAVFFVVHAVHETNDGSTFVESADTAVAA